MLKINNKFNKYFPKKYPVFFIHTHPDDESFLSAGLINKIIKNGNQCIIIYTSASKIAEIRKTKIRQQEAINACKILGSPGVEFLNYCDFKYNDLKVATILNKKSDIIERDMFSIINKYTENKFILFIYDKNGGYGNIEHKKNYKIGMSFFSKNTDKILKLYLLTINRDVIKKWFKKNKSILNKKDLPDLSYWSKKFGLTTKEIDYYYELDNHDIKRKKMALIEHKTQIKKDEFPISLKPKDFTNIFGREYIKQVFEDKKINLNPHK